MKKFILALCFTILSLSFSYGQGPPPPPGCECCADFSGQALADCNLACELDEEGDYCSDALPLDSNAILLFTLAISLGGYVIIKNKRKLLKN